VRKLARTAVRSLSPLFGLIYVHDSSGATD
jgi:hypothetical protein